MDVPALIINKVCLSGVDAIALADQLIRAGEFDIVVAGGQESMTQAPHLLAKSRAGFKYGDVTMLDHMAYDGLHDSFDQVSMGASTEKHNSRYEITRADQDEVASAVMTDADLPVSTTESATATVVCSGDACEVEVDLTGPRAGRSRVHCTAWDSRRDEIVEMPERHRR